MFKRGVLDWFKVDNVANLGYTAQLKSYLAKVAIILPSFMAILRLIPYVFALCVITN